MRRLTSVIVCILACGTAAAQTRARPDADAPQPAVAAALQPAAGPQVVMVPTVRPALGAASRAARHESLAQDRRQRLAEQAEDRDEAQRRRGGDAAPDRATGR